MNESAESPFLKFLEAGVEKGGFETDDVLAALVPLMKQVRAAHEAGVVAPLDGIEHLSLAGQGDLMFAPTQVSSPEKNASKVEALQSPVSHAAEVALQRSARNVDFVVQWNFKRWQIELLKFSPTAEAALTEALDAHLIVVACASAKSSIFWFRVWLDHWAKCHQIEGAALALFGVGHSDGLAASAINEFSIIARRHRLSLIFDNGRSGKDQSNFIEHSLDGQELLASKLVIPILDEQARHPYQRWGINE